MNRLFFHLIRLSCLLLGVWLSMLLVAATLAGVAAAHDQHSSHPLNERRPALSPRRSRPQLPAVAQSVISAAIGRDQASYHAAPVPGGFRLRNPRSNLRATFTRQGVRVERGDASWGIGLQAYGAGGNLQRVTPARPQAAGNRVEYRRAGLVEWYVNGPAGLEQGFTIPQQPRGAPNGTLKLAFALSGNLTARVDAARRNLILSGGAAQAQLRYTGLAARDATGRELPSWLEVRGGRLLVEVAAAGARYPVVVDPYVQAAKLTASDDGFDDELGYSVSVSADDSTVVAGAWAATVGSNDYQGAAYVFGRPASGWATESEAAKLTALNGSAYDQLGSSVSVSADGSTVVAGAPGANGYHGAAYVFVNSGGWTQTATLTASDGAANDDLGWSVGVSGDGSTVTVGAPYVHNGSLFGQGAAYIFVKSGGWADTTETAKLTASDALHSSELGFSVSVSGDGSTVVAGAPYAHIGSNNAQGEAYVFMKPGSWADMTETARLTASDGVAGDKLGWSASVSADGSTVVAGAPYATVGSNLQQGAAYVFVKSGSWADMTETARLTASDGAGSDQLGWSASVSGDGSTVVAGAPYTTVGSIDYQGAAYVFGPLPCTGTGVSLSASLAGGNPTPAAGDTDTWIVKLDAQACQAATGLKIQGGTDGWRTFTSVDPPSIGGYEVKPHKRNEVITWTVDSLGAGRDAVLTLEIQGTIKPGTRSGTVLDLIGPWSVVFSTDGGVTYQKSDYTAPVTLTVQ